MIQVKNHYSADDSSNRNCDFAKKVCSADDSSYEKCDFAKAACIILMNQVIILMNQVKKTSIVQ